MNTMLFHRVAVFEEQGFNVAFVALLAGFSGLLTFPGRYFAPRISDHIKPTTVFNWSIVGIVGAMILAIIGSPMIVMIAHFILFGLFFGFSLPMRAVIMSNWYAGPDFGSVMGKQWGVAAVVAGFTPFIVGAARDELGSYTIPLIGLTMAVAVSGLFNALAARRDRTQIVVQGQSR
jgi:cyanate permease